jgi:hypothetical protein
MLCPAGSLRGDLHHFEEPWSISADYRELSKKLKMRARSNQYIHQTNSGAICVVDWKLTNVIAFMGSMLSVGDLLRGIYIIASFSFNGNEIRLESRWRVALLIRDMPVNLDQSRSNRRATRLSLRRRTQVKIATREDRDDSVVPSLREYELRPNEDDHLDRITTRGIAVIVEVVLAMCALSLLIGFLGN